MPTKKTPAEVEKAPRGLHKRKRPVVSSSLQSPEPAPLATAAPAVRSGLSGEGASSALAHMIEQEKIRIDKAGDS